ncbi:thialysine N-epsilon-acetyltransferase-like isoform X2 [Aquarana catesbeiana]|uniref:thialysine N-epsilon-acetyltransferase-like isoform X2 n=1 Tax=Aquarana catesbeiana TaxID=8400 RepID=UPI003CC92EC4
MESRECSVHKKILEYYCTEDNTCICTICVAGEHQGHQMEILDKASEKKKETLRNVLQKLLTKREETEERVQSLQEHRRKVEEEEAGDTERVTALFRDLRGRLEDLEKRVLVEISGRAERVSISIRDLEIKKEELSRKMRHIEELCNTTEPLTVLQESDTGLRRDGFEEPSPLFHCLVAEEEDEQKRAEGPRLVGYALSHYIYNTFKGRALYLEDLFVMPQYRGKGIGSKLLTATAELCLSLGCARLQLSVLDWNQSAISFYQSRGGRNMSKEEGWLMIWFFPDDLQQMVSKNAEQDGDPGLL